MRHLLLVLVLSTSSSVLAAQGSGPSARLATVTAGVGNSMGWLGLQGERYLRNDRVSIFGGLGYTPELETGDASGVAVAAGVRGYTPGVRHRGFLELSVSQLEIGAACFDDCQRNYGPGIQVGYQYAALGGFTLTASAGVGRSFGDNGGAVAILGFGLGYTWRR